jgi:putative hydrolase
VIFVKFIADLHVHTVASGHAYSTVLEIAQATAAKNELKMIALTDHGTKMPGGPHSYHFANLVAIPERVSGIRILKGIEANLIDLKGTLDLEKQYLERLDVVAAGLHAFCCPVGSSKDNTTMIVNAIKSGSVDIIVHPGNPEFLIDEAAVVEAATKFDVALEINNCSLTAARLGSEAHCHHIIQLAKVAKTKLIVGSDSHFAETVGDFGAAAEILVDHGIPEEQVLNTSIERLLSHLNRRKNRNHPVTF